MQIELHEDRFLRILWDEGARIIGIDWKESTAVMTSEEFKQELTVFAGYVEEKKAPAIIVDVSKFGHKMSPDVQPWRIKNISTRYNAAGVKRFAFLFAKDTLIPPTLSQSSEGEQFLTRAFNNLSEATAWLTTGA